MGEWHNMDAGCIGSLDALIVGYYEGERLLYADKVRNGFVPLVRREVASKFKGLESDTCPFANLPEKKRTMWALTKEEMKNCVWLKPELVAQIEFTEWTPDNPFFGQVVKLKFLRVWYCPEAEVCDGGSETEAAYGRV